MIVTGRSVWSSAFRRSPRGLARPPPEGGTPNGGPNSKKGFDPTPLLRQTKMMNILVTGHRGYIGPHLVKLLKEAGHQVTGVDIGYFEACAWEPLPEADRELHADFRTLTERDLEPFDCVCHLAAI